MTNPTVRQCQIAELVAIEGLTVQEVAARLGISYFTAKRLLYGNAGWPGLLGRIGARSLVDLTRWYWAEGGRAECDVTLSLWRHHERATG